MPLLNSRTDALLGRYQRKARKQSSVASTHTPTENARINDPDTSSAVHNPLTTESSAGPASTPTHVSLSARQGTPKEKVFFFGESNLLTCVTGTIARDETDTLEARKNQLCYSISDETQPPDGRAGTPAGESHRSYKIQYLEDEGAFKLPDAHNYLPALQAYFQWFHPCFPILDKAETAQQFSAGTLSPLLLQAVLFIGATYCDEDAILRLGFQDRREAKHQLYNRAKILFEADWETDKVITLQTVFLLSFWRAGISDIKDVRYWLGIAVTLAQSSGFHRS